MHANKVVVALANKIAQTPPPQRDPEAEELIRERIGSRPDALYILTQTVLIQNLALEQAQKQIHDLQQRGSQVQGQGRSFLGSSPQVSQMHPSGQQSSPGYGSAPPLPSAPSSGWFGSGSGSSFLRGAATTAAGVAAGLKNAGQRDLALVVNDGPSRAAAGVFTRNRVKAAPVLWSEQVLRGGRVHAVVLNSGGANACTGPDGFQDTHQTAEEAADVLGESAAEIAICSTGLIGDRLPMDRLLQGVTAAAEELSRDGGLAAAANFPNP